MRNIILFITG